MNALASVDASMMKWSAPKVIHIGCENTPICLPTKGAPGKDGNECPVNCPCMPEDQTCDMGFDEYTGCQHAPQCMPWKEGDCPTFCPCKSDEQHCDMGFDDMGCMMQPMCMPMKGGPMGKDGIECPVTCPCKADENTCDM